MREIELLAPAKSYDAARAAIDHGADALYMGGARFGARAAAGNSIEEIARATEYAHQYGARLYATLNTLIFEDELAEAQEFARQIVATGVDALIVQDLAFARMGLDCELHASTQMCNATVEGVRFLCDLGFKRVVLERTLTLQQIEDISKSCDAEIEAFVHGAICVGYSGRCYLSRCFNPQRSGNRGECSQPCRLSYDLVGCDDQIVVEGKHLLSVRDMNLTDRVEELILSGVSSLKIEGRLKELSYTKNVVAHYRRVVDKIIEKHPDLRRSSCGVSTKEFEPNSSKSFSRGGTSYLFDWQQGGIASLDSPKALGEEVGVILSQRGERLYVELTSELATGDGVCFLVGTELVGSNINSVGEGWITLNRRGDIERGATLYRNYDRRFEGEVESSRTRRTITTKCSITTSKRGIEVEYRDEDGYQGCATADDEMTRATNAEQMEEMIRRQLSKSGSTIFTVSEVSTAGWRGEFIASKTLAQLRRDALDKLRESRLKGAETKRASHFEESPTPLYPTTTIDGATGVTNSLAESLYRDHGVEQIEASYERSTNLIGAEVLTSSYCIRGEIGECLRKGSKLREELFLRRGRVRFRLSFDCERCRMSLIKE